MAQRILFFTHHKCASMFVHRVCRDLARAAGIPYHSPNGGDHAVTIRELAAPRAWRGRHGCFAPLRIFVPVPAQARVLLHLRDPRDVLVSMFYSYCYSHAGEVPGGTGYRREVAEAGIDAFVIALATSERAPVRGDYGTGAHLWDLAGSVGDRYRAYLDHLVGQPQVTLMRYEDMLADLDGWLARVAAAFGLDAAGSLVTDLADAYRPALRVAHEDPWAHTRRITPGDHREKLEPRTVARLDAVFGEALVRLGYRD